MHARPSADVPGAQVRRPAAAVPEDAGQHVADAGPAPGVTEARNSDSGARSTVVRALHRRAGTDRRAPRPTSSHVRRRLPGVPQQQHVRRRCPLAVSKFAACVADINAWLSACRLRLNAAKTQLLWFGSSQLVDRVDCHVDVLVLGTRVAISDNADDLVVIDPELSV